MTNFIEIIGPYDLVAKGRNNVIHENFKNEENARQAFEKTVASGSANEALLFRFDKNDNHGVQLIASWKRK